MHLALNHRVLNVTRGFTMKRKQAMKAVENGVMAWDKPGETVRDMTLPEKLSFQKAAPVQKPAIEALPLAELPELIVKRPARAKYSAQSEYELVIAADRFALQATQARQATEAFRARQATA